MSNLSNLQHRLPCYKSFLPCESCLVYCRGLPPMNLSMWPYIASWMTSLGYMWLTERFIMQMTNTTTRRTPGAFGDTGASSSLPEPPPLTPLEQLLASQTAILQQLAQNQAPPPPSHRHDHRPQVASFGDLLGTQPPLFSKADEPLEADAWIRAIESK